MPDDLDPPVLLDDYRAFALHPLIPKLSQKELEESRAWKTVDDEIIEFSMDMEDQTTLVAPGQRAGASTMGMDYGMEHGLGMEEGWTA